MVISPEKVEEAIAELKEKYLSVNPYHHYLFGFGISTLETMLQKGEDLKHRESPDDSCIVAYVKKRLPKDLDFPLEYIVTDLNN